MNLESSPARNDGIVARSTAEALILLDPASGEYFTLDEVGGRVWELCDGSRSVSEIAAILTGEYEAPLDQVRTDVLELLGELYESRLVV